MPEPLKRLPDWHSRLVKAMEAVRREPFVWGQHDCGIDWAGRAVAAVTGVDVAAPYRGAKYKTARGAAGVLRRAGFNDLGELAAHHLPEIHPSRAVMGDIAAIRTGSAVGYSLGIINGDTILVLGETGMRVIDLLEADRAFAVGARQA